MRRLLAISLLMLFGLPFALPFLRTRAAEAGVPVCCRRGGRHHCLMATDSDPGSSMHTIGEKCPYSIAPPAIAVLPSFTPSPSWAIFAEIVRHPASRPQVEALRRISFDRARQKRGPPAETV